MKATTRFLTRSLTSHRFDAQMGRVVCWFTSILVLVLGFLTLTRLELTQAELFFGLLLVVAVSMLGVLIGLVLPMVVDHDAQKRSG